MKSPTIISSTGATHGQQEEARSKEAQPVRQEKQGGGEEGRHAVLSLPTLLYRTPGPYDGTPIDGKSTTYDCLGVKTEEEHAAALAAGWHPRLVDALCPAPAPVVAPVVLDEEPVAVDDLRVLELDELRAIAKDIDGYDGRLGKEKLIALIEKARA